MAAKKKTPKNGKTAVKTRSATKPSANTAVSVGRPSLTSLQLRKLAENADGTRGVPLQLMWAPEDGTPPEGAAYGYRILKPTAAAASATGSEVLCSIMTPWENPTRGDARPVVTLKVGGQAPRELQDDYDAVFWGEAAIEKFVFGYYLRMLPFAEFTKLYTAYMNPPPDASQILGMIHLPGSDYEFINADPLAGLKLITATGIYGAKEYFLANNIT